MNIPLALHNQIRFFKQLENYPLVTYYLICLFFLQKINLTDNPIDYIIDGASEFDVLNLPLHIDHGKIMDPYRVKYLRNILQISPKPSLLFVQFR
jgi:hypothetical protein